MRRLLSHPSIAKMNKKGLVEKKRMPTYPSVCCNGKKMEENDNLNHKIVHNEISRQTRGQGLCGPLGQASLSPDPWGWTDLHLARPSGSGRTGVTPNPQ